MNKRKHNSAHDDRLFMKFFYDVMDSPAWREMSHGAKALYLRLRRRYNATTDNNGKIYLPQRLAETELNSKRDYIGRWFRELQYYGFIVLVSAGHLGVHGYGRAPCWRLTELACNGKPPTLDYLAWNGVPFDEEKTESRSAKADHHGPQKGANGGPQKGAKGNFAHWPTKGGQGVVRKSGPNLDSSSHLREGRGVSANAGAGICAHPQAAPVASQK